jgi:hypothetical protein
MPALQLEQAGASTSMPARRYQTVPAQGTPDAADPERHNSRWSRGLGLVTNKYCSGLNNVPSCDDSSETPSR